MFLKALNAIYLPISDSDASEVVTGKKEWTMALKKVSITYLSETNLSYQHSLPDMVSPNLCARVKIASLLKKCMEFLALGAWRPY